MFDLEKMFKLNSDLLILFKRIRELNLEWLTLIEGPANLTEIFSELLTLKFISEKIFEIYSTFQLDKLKSHKYFWESVKVPSFWFPFFRKYSVTSEFQTIQILIQKLYDIKYEMPTFNEVRIMCFELSSKTFL